MKKIVLGIFTLTLIGATAVSCKKKAAKVDCETASANVQSALDAFAESPTADNCIKYKKALQDMLKSECMNRMPAEQKAQYEAMLAEMQCQ